LDVTNQLGNAKMAFPIIELAKIPSVISQIKEALGLEEINQPNQVVDDNEDAPIILQTMNQEGEETQATNHSSYRY
jgi:hypothetical protein